MEESKKKTTPPHPGEILHCEYMEPLGLSPEKLAQALGVSARTIRFILKGVLSVSIQMAIRLGKAFGTGPRYWLNLQMEFDLYRVGNKINTLRIYNLLQTRKEKTFAECKKNS